MLTNKRRRAIDIHESVYQLLKQESEKRGCKTPTSLLSKILTGEAAPIKGKPDLNVSKSHSVSMTEALWLSLRMRREQFNNVPIKVVASSIILGQHVPLKESELMKGEAEAAHREQGRAGKAKATPRKKKVKKADPQIEEIVHPISKPLLQENREMMKIVTKTSKKNEGHHKSDPVEPIEVQEAEKKPVVKPEYTAIDDDPKIENSEDSKPILQPPVEKKMVDSPAISEQEEFYGGVKLF